MDGRMVFLFLLLIAGLVSSKQLFYYNRTTDHFYHCNKYFLCLYKELRASEQLSEFSGAL
jgi:hypothetical protein